MNLILAGRFPASAHPRVLERMRACRAAPRIAWIAPDSDTAQEQFPAWASALKALGFTELEACDIDRDVDEVQLAYLYEFDIICLSQGDPLVFRYNMLRTGLSGRLRQCVTLNRLIIASDEAATLLSPNVSTHRLASEPLESVMSNRERFDGMGAVAYELLPRFEERSAEELERVRQYSSRIDHDVVALGGDAVIFAETPRSFDYVGTLARFRGGVREDYN